MGNCATGADVSRARNDAVEEAIKQAMEAERSVVKILLLGTGNSGKSTILKQFKLLHSDQKLGDHSQHKHVISTNVLRGIAVVAAGVNDLEEVTIPFTARQAEIVKVVTENAQGLDIWGEAEIEGKSEQIAQLCTELWNSEAMQQCMEFESKLSMLEVPIAYFMKHIDRISLADYVPSTDDILQARVRTSGVVKIEFTLDSIKCRMLDVGGQRNERKKWISHFDNVTAIMFLVSLSEYDKYLLEDSTTNRMHDAMQVFEYIVGCPYFEETNIILFLNKKDLFEEKIKKISLAVCFPDYEYGVEGEFEKAIDFVQEKFVQVFRQTKESAGIDPMSSDIYPFPTMATNTNNVRTVFNMCKHIIFKTNLGKSFGVFLVLLFESLWRQKGQANPVFVLSFSFFLSCVTLPLASTGMF